MPTQRSRKRTKEAERRSVAIDDRLQEVHEPDEQIDHGPTPATMGLPAFILARIDALEKPRMEEELVDPEGGSGSPCTCNTVCTCVPVLSCACDTVCVCHTVSSCHSYQAGGGGGGGGCGCVPIVIPKCR